MDKLDTSNNKSYDFDPEKHCAICSCNGGIKKHNYFFKHRFKAKVCLNCERKKFNLKSNDIIAWLEENAIFEDLKLIGFKGDQNAL